MITRKINNEKIQQIPKTRPLANVKGKNLFERPFTSKFLLGKTESGKTTTLYNILKKTAGKDTRVHIFAGSVYNDDSYLKIMQMLKSRGIQFDQHCSILPKIDPSFERMLADLVHENEGRVEKLLNGSDSESDDEINERDIIIYPAAVLAVRQEAIDKKKAEKVRVRPKPGKIAPEHIFVFDDLSEEMRNNSSIASLLKKHRHLKSSVIIASQWLNDLPLGGRGQLSYVLMYPLIPEDKLEEIHRNLSIATSYPVFRELYARATAPDGPGRSYNFLYVDVVRNKFRKNFTDEFLV